MVRSGTVKQVKNLSSSFEILQRKDFLRCVFEADACVATVSEIDPSVTVSKASKTRRRGSNDKAEWHVDRNRKSAFFMEQPDDMMSSDCENNGEDEADAEDDLTTTFPTPSWLEWVWFVGSTSYRLCP